MQVIAFSGNSNTGKTTAINFLYDHFSTHFPDKRVLLLQESAREYLQAHGGTIDDMYDFQTYIFRQEVARLHEIERMARQDEYDLVFIDRTAMDGMIYSYRNIISGEMERMDFASNHYELISLSKQLYDHVVFFTTPIHIDKRFANYNNEHINAIFEHSIKWFYGDRVTTYTNNIFFQDNRENTLFGNIFGG